MSRILASLHTRRLSSSAYRSGLSDRLRSYGDPSYKQPEPNEFHKFATPTNTPNGKGKGKVAPFFEAAAQDALARKSELWQALHELHRQLQVLEHKALSISKKLKEKQTKSAHSLEDEWGPDRLAPPAETEEVWYAKPQNHSIPEPIDRTAKGALTEILSGQELLFSSKLQFRDERGRLSPTVTFQSVDTDETRRYNEPITGSISSKNVPIEKVAPLRKMQVATLAHGLDRVLFNPGVTWMRDPRSGIYNFDPRIRNILDVDLFDYAALPPYITSSKDPELDKLTKQHAKKYCGSTSSMTSLLSQCYFHISGWRNPNTQGFSEPFATQGSGFSAGAKLPASVMLHYKDGHYAIDADKGAAGELENSNYVLTSLGKSMEKMLTSSPEEYARYTRINSHKLSEAEKSKPEAYHYASTSKMMMRSQLDCHDDRLPRKTFDLKTRASVGIRHDRANYVEGSGYQIRRATGLLESFEREYFDMVRAAFLKYNFQARIGHMDGIMVAYHNTSHIFGFQYIPVEEMNERLFGTQEMAEQAFKLSLGMMEQVLDAATAMFPEQTVRITIDGKEKGDGPMSLYVEPVGAEASADVTAVQPESETPSETAESDDSRKPKRTIVQLDVHVDRFLDGGLVRGPVDFTVLPGRRVDYSTDDEIERRLRESLPEVQWEIDFRITPRPDLTEGRVRQNLEAVRAKQTSVNSLIMPNVEALNEREKYRIETLGKNPEALKRFIEERASGAAAGMPLAPGQLSAEDSSSSTSSASTIAGEEQDPTNKPAARKTEVYNRFTRMNHKRLIRLRELAKLGAKDLELASASDKSILYTSQS